MILEIDTKLKDTLSYSYLKAYSHSKCTLRCDTVVKKMCST